MKIFTLLFSLLTVLFVKDSSALANPLTLPEPQGVYGIGMLNVELSDPTRTQLRSGDKRRWMATVFYPTLKTKATSPYMTGTIDDGNVCGTKVLGHAIQGATIIQNRKFPVIMSLPGRGNVRSQNTILYEALLLAMMNANNTRYRFLKYFIKLPPCKSYLKSVAEKHMFFLENSSRINLVVSAIALSACCALSFLFENV